MIAFEGRSNFSFKNQFFIFPSKYFLWDGFKLNLVNFFWAGSMCRPLVELTLPCSQFTCKSHSGPIGLKCECYHLCYAAPIIYLSMGCGCNKAAVAETRFMTERSWLRIQLGDGLFFFSILLSVLHLQLRPLMKAHHY